MPRRFRKARVRNVPFRKKRPWYRKKYSVGQIAQKAWSGMRYIKGLINVERKFFDVTAVTSPDNSGTVINLSNIAEGTDYNNRDGNSILLQNLLFRVNTSGNVAGNNIFVRAIIFADNYQTGTDPTVLNLLETASTNSPLNHVTSKRFTIYKDFKWTLDLYNPTKTMKKYIKFPQSTHIKYQNTTGADASNWEGSLYLLLISDQATNKPSVDWYARLRFTDN